MRAHRQRKTTAGRGQPRELHGVGDDDHLAGRRRSQFAGVLWRGKGEQLLFAVGGESDVLDSDLPVILHWITGNYFKMVLFVRQSENDILNSDFSRHPPLDFGKLI